MAFPTGRNKKPLIELVNTIQYQLINLKEYANGLLAMMANPVSVNQILDLLQVLNQSAALLENAKTVPGLIEFAQAQFYETDLDLMELGLSVLSIIGETRTAVIAIIPVDTDGYILKDQLQEDGNTRTVSLQPNQLTALQDPLQRLAAAID